MRNWKTKYFDKKEKAVDFMMADLEFKRFKLDIEREDKREGYDTSRARLDNVLKSIEEQKKTPTLSEDEIKRLDDDKIRLESEIEKFKAQMDFIDGEITGLPQSAEYPDGVTGINQQLDALRSLKVIIKEYKKIL